ncbi:acyltransferase family protein [Paraburkholderia strydomiana]|uniref:acyltransferase family protein n=1 Tax=Paraburkholderia strydomiana TaxID=1245417 RepID=UPI002856598E|nr:acyltransferase [Paraburkholderia strydomiana]MDR7005812.1 peptidoglycan/LPS O-acetylase OafA/YrhL [Paraburkholderia strydomiana]
MKNRNFGLDVVRMCAILPVLVVHFSIFAVQHVPAIIYVMGDLGVELFFALSGFLIGGIILRDFEHGFSWRVARNFYVRRWMRTLPIYYVIFIATCFVTVDGITLRNAWSNSYLTYLVFLQNLAWPMIDWYQESWSLAVEEWFYLIFPVFFACLVGMRARTRILVIALTLIVVPLALRILAYDPALEFDRNIRQVVVMRLDAIAFGIVAIWLVRAFETTLRRWAHLIGLVGVMGATLTITFMMGHLYPGDFFSRTFTYSLAPASFAALVIWAHFQQWREVKVVRWVSVRSYALYLCNFSVLRTMKHQGWISTTPIISLLIFSIGVIFIAEIVHRLIERPIMIRRPKELRSTEAKVPDNNQVAA